MPKTRFVMTTPAKAPATAAVVPLGDRRNTADRPNLYQHHFPVGIFVDVTRHWIRNGVDKSLSSDAELQEMLDEFATMGIFDIYLNGAWTVAHSLYAVEYEGRPQLQKRMRMAIGATGRTTINNQNTSLDVAWYGSGIADTLANALPLAQLRVDQVAPYKSIIAYALADDAAVSNVNGTKSYTMVRALQQLDPTRPASAMFVFNAGDTTIPDALGDDLKLMFTYSYPCGMTPSPTTISLEGDFHRDTMTSYGGDWTDRLRDTQALMPGVPIWHMLQIHGDVAPAGASSIRKPTTRELRAQVWQAIGEGVKGFFWFIWNIYDTTSWDGLGDDGMTSERAVVAEMAHRLTDGIKQRLLTCDRVAPLFTASGGGSSGYPVNYANAYCSTLQDRTSGTKYVVLCNHALTTQNVTVSSATLTGSLVSLETGTRYRLGVTAISLPALDGSIYQHDPEIGVPPFDEDLTTDVVTWWAGHWANPVSANFRAVASMPTHPTVIDVTNGQDLQAVIEAHPGDNITFRLAAGASFGYVAINACRNGLHIISADPNNKATISGGDWSGSTLADTYAGWLAKVLGSSGTAAQKDQAQWEWEHPAHDWLFRDIKFTWDGQIPQSALQLRGVKDVLFERCEFSGYQMGTQAGGPGTAITGIPASHPGVLAGHGGIRNVVVRNCTITLAQNSSGNGFPYAIYFDGGIACAFVDNTVSGKSHTGVFLFLCNDDFTDYYGRSFIDDSLGDRNPRFNVVRGNTSTATNASSLVNYTGSRLLVRDNAMTIASVAAFANLPSRCSRHYTKAHVYYDYDQRFISNTVTGNVTDFVLMDSQGGAQCVPGGPDYTVASRGRIGKATITGNTVSGTIAKWLDADVNVDGPHTISGNNKNDGTGVGV